jgi:hypothetical protein
MAPEDRTDFGEDEGGMLLLGLWRLSHTDGSHPGPVQADEARFRYTSPPPRCAFFCRTSRGDLAKCALAAALRCCTR